MTKSFLDSLLGVIAAIVCIFISLAAFLFLLFLRSIMLNHYSYSLHSSPWPMILVIFIFILLSSWSIFWLGIISCALLLLLRRREKTIFTTIKVALIIIYLIFVYVELTSVFSNTLAFNSLFGRAEYPNVSEYRFEKEVDFDNSYRSINFTAHDDIHTVFEYYRNNLGNGRSLDNPEAEVQDLNVVDNPHSEPNSNYWIVQLRVRKSGSPYSWVYRIDLFSEKGSNQTIVRITGSNSVTWY